MFGLSHLHFERIFHFGDDMASAPPGTYTSRDSEPFYNFKGEHIKFYTPYIIINTLFSCPLGIYLTHPFSPTHADIQQQNKCHIHCLRYQSESLICIKAIYFNPENNPKRYVGKTQAQRGEEQFRIAVSERKT